MEKVEHVADLASFKLAVIKRSSIKGQITKFKGYLDKVISKPQLSNIEITELNLKLAKFEALSTKFEDLQSEIEVLNSANLDDECDIRENFEHTFIMSIATAKNLLDNYSASRRHSAPNQCSFDPHESSIKLPQIQIAKFDGSFFRWLEFRDTFKSLIHKNVQMSPIQKFYYLNSYLEGEAARVISNLEVSANNYDEAWSLLNERYDNKRLLIDHHLDSLCNIQPITRESEKSIRFLVDHVNKNLRALSTLDLPTGHWDILLIHLLSKKLDSRTFTKWEETRNALVDIPTLSDFNNFLIDRANVLQAVNRNNFYHQVPRSTPSPKNSVKGTQLSFASTKPDVPTSYNKNCVICNDSNHRIYDCPIFKGKNITERMTDVSMHKLCSNCLRQGHTKLQCKMGPCRLCKGRHNTLLHSATPHTNVSTTTNTAIPVTNTDNTVVSFSKQNNANVHYTTQVLLSTALIKVTNPITKKSFKVRALLDCGSQSSFISQSLRDKLSLKTNQIDTLNIVGIGNNSSNQVKENCIVQLSSLVNKYQVTLSCLVLGELTGELPRAPINIHALALPNNIRLADPNFGQPAPIDVLIGADLFWDILRGEQRPLGPKYNLKLQNTLLGWLVAGPIPCHSKLPIQCNHMVLSTSSEDDLVNEYLPKFWELEELPQKIVLSENDKICEEHFLTHTVRESTGRFCVKLPLIESSDCLGDSYYSAKKRLLNLEKRFTKNSALKSQYVDFIQEYAELNHLSESSTYKPNPSYFLCHHAVFKKDSESTKTRVVFDGSNTTSSGYSLNDILMVGPNVQDSLFSILVRARQYKYLLCGDIEKMYRQINVHDEDRNLQLILWRKDESQPIKTLRLNTLTYGTASASYLSTKCLWKVGEECEDDTIKTIIQKDFYVDDLITGANDEQQLRHIKKSVSIALNSACFKLRKFKSNLPSIFESSELDTHQDLTISESSNTLGLGWNPSNDNLHFPIQLPCLNKPITKRFIMSNSFKIFDPLGILSPCIIKPKMILQDLWSQKVDWDEAVNQNIKNEWFEFTDNLNALSRLQVPRRVICDSPKVIEMHSFSDASQRAYGSSIYIRSIDQNNGVTVKLLCAKSKVASLKPVTIPRLELCAALLAARLCKSVLDAVRYQPSRIVHWCDSTVVLAWLKTNPNKLKTFVANRVGEINDTTKSSSWKYVPSASNPADLISRGVTASQLQDLDLWWSGPSFLTKDESQWPNLTYQNEIDDLPEIKNLKSNTTQKTKHMQTKSILQTKNLTTTNSKAPTHLVTNKNVQHSNSFITSTVSFEPIINFEHFSKLTKLQRTVAYVQRYVFNLKNSKNKQLGILTTDELNKSFTYLCSLAQKQSFPVEFDLLSRSLPLKPKSKFISLSPFFEDNVIRVGGRIGNSQYCYNKKHPIILESSHHLTRLIFEREHILTLHAGPQLLLANIREIIWPLNGRIVARRTVNNCVRCRRVQPKTLCPKMGNLPPQRLHPDFPFKSTGVDFAGPFQIINRKGRGAKVVKCYLCLFVCMKYKCIHLEAVSDLTGNAFVMTLRRFISRRGKPAEVFCDNGRNFVAANKELATFLKKNNGPLSEFAAQEGIRFNFIPAYAPHFGGIWESGVKSAKFHLRRVMGNSHLTYEELSTLFAQVEAVLNSRPLCPLSNSPNDFLYLSPGHFLVGRPLTAVPTPALEDRADTSLARYERLEKVHQHFWNRWQREYIAELQQRRKWKTDTKQNLNIGDLVLIHEDHVPPLCWRLGRVQRLFPGSDGISRVADINTTRGLIRRPLVRLCPLHPEPHQC